MLPNLAARAPIVFSPFAHLLTYPQRRLKQMETIVLFDPKAAQSQHGGFRKYNCTPQNKSSLTPCDMEVAMHTRRDFIKKAISLSGAAGVSTVVPECVQRAFAIVPDPGTSYLDAEHVTCLRICGRTHSVHEWQ